MIKYPKELKRELDLCEDADWGIFCPLCNAWFVKSNFNKHLGSKHPLIIEKAREGYWKLVKTLLDEEHSN